MTDLVPVRLLPYEQALARELGVSEEEILTLRALQRDPSLDPAARADEIRMDPITIGVTLLVVGTIMQVVGAMLMRAEQKPKAPQGRRSETFAPRYGFSSTQQLAQYGDPITLVYTNKRQNPNGGVRVATSLLWSAIESFGTTQYMQLLLLVGAATIREVDFERCAFGQLPVRDFGDANLWIYWEPTNGPVRFGGSKVLGLKGDPARDGASSGDIVHRIKDGANWRTGFSQAFSPTSMTACGAWAPIPINVDWMERGQEGRRRWKPLRITLAAGGWGGSGGRYRKGDRITVRFDKIDRKKGGITVESARDAREQLVTNLDIGGTYILGSARFRVVSISDEVNLQKNNVSCTLECISPGRHPASNYGRTRAKRGLGEDREQQVDDAIDILMNRAEEGTDEKPSSRTSAYNSAPTNSTRLNPSGSRPNRSAYLPASDVEAELGLDPDDRRDEGLRNTLRTDNVTINAFGIRWEFSGTQNVTWINDLDARQSVSIARSGSIRRTKRDLEAFLSNKPKISTKKLRKEYRSDLEKARQLREDVLSGEFDKKFRLESRALNRTLKAVVAEIDLRLENRRDAEKAFEPNNDRIKDLENECDDLTESIQKARENGNLDRVEKLRAERKAKRQRIRELKRDRDTGDDGKKKLADLRLKDLREIKRDLESEDINVRRKAYVRFIRTAKNAFVGLDGNRYAGGIRWLADKIDDLKGEFTTDQVGVSAVRAAYRQLIKDKQQALRDARWLAKNWDTLERDLDDSFYVRALCREESAAYQTVTACSYVKLNFRVRVYRRISGRDKRYGKKEAPDGWKRSDNGIKRRMMFFTIRYRDSEAGGWERVPTIFCVQRAANQDNFISVNFEAPTKEPSKWEFDIQPVIDPASEFLENKEVDYTFIENAGRRRGISVSSGRFSVYGNKVDKDWNFYPALEERGPLDTNEWDLFSNRSDSRLEGSFQDGPEMTLTSVTEQQKGPITGMYQNMSLMAFHVFAGKGLQDMRSVSAFVKEGKDSWIINTSTRQPQKSADSTSYGPDIFADTVLDPVNAMGDVANPGGIDWERLALAKRFCQNNGLGTQLFMDGVVAEEGSWREFWAATAPFSLLEFARIGGRDTLVPAIPCTADGRATRAITISGVFTPGNILPGTLKENFLDYGDNTRDLVATGIYREVRRKEVFPRNNSVTICLTDTNLNDATWQTFDLSDWVCTRLQVELYLRLLCRQRRLIRRAIEFKTIPTDTLIEPGGYYLVDTGRTTWDNILSGVVEPGGSLNLPLRTNAVNGSYSAILYKGNGQKPVSLSGISVSGNAAPALAPYAGWMVVLGNLASSRSVWRIADVEVDGSGEVTVKAVEHPVTGTGSSLLSLVADLAPGGFRTVGLDSF